MFKKLTLAGAVLAMGATSLVPATATAQRGGGYYGDRYDRSYNDRRYNDRRDDRRYDRRNYRGRQQRCDNGDGGTVIGAIAGGLLGNTVAGRGDKLLGTVIGAGGGALAGRAIDRSDNRGYCRR
ncbi:MAG TPA: glycine zipper 2TM domain-containing protein [Sphingomonas sp.]|jgi:uncharacterized protein YcfJ|nr:glycine zipper 2TM domain-containing protein [Sphingomonas sp.]